MPERRSEATPIPIPANEVDRLAVLHRYEILDTPPEAAFDRITSLAARLLKMPIALVSLVDAARGWFKSRYGIDWQELSRDATFCSFALLHLDVLMVPDTHLDDRFVCNPLVQNEPGIRFYAGAPLLTQDGFNLGALCVLDVQPHEALSLEQQATLVDLAAIVVDELELRLAGRQIIQQEQAQRESETKYRTLFESIDEGFCICEMLFDANDQPADYRLLEINPIFEQLTGLEQATGKTARQLVPDLEAEWFEIYSKVVRTGESVRFENQSSALNRWFNVNAFRIGAPESNQFAVLFTNISDRKTVEQERDRFLAVGSDLQVIAGSDGYFHWVSPTFERVLGWTISEMTSRPWTDFVHPDDIGESVAESASLFSGGETFEFENRYRHKDGSYRWFLWNAQSYPEEQVIYGTAVDISDRKRAEQVLRQSEEQSRYILESITDAFFAVDENWRFTYVNQTAYTLVNRTPGDLIGKNFWEEFPGLEGSAFEQMHQRVMQNRVAESLIEFYPDHDRWYEVRSFPAVNGMTIYFKNVTDQIQAEAALRSSEARFRRIFECNMIGIGIWTRSGDIIEANDALLEILGYTRQDLNAGGLNWQNITPPEYRERDDQALAELAARGTCTPFEKEYIHQQGQRVPVLIGAGAFEDTPDAGIFYAVDLTERRSVEAALRQSESRFRLVVESAKEYAIFTLDLTGVVTSWNSGAELLFGYAAAEILDCHSHILYTPEDNEQGRDDRERQTALTQGQAKNECWHLRKDRSRFWGSGLVMPLRDETGNTQGFVKIMQDKTAQRQADERFRLLYDTTSDLLATAQPLTLMHNLFTKLSDQLELGYYYYYRVEEKDDRPMLHLISSEGLSDLIAESVEWIEFGEQLCGMVAQERRQLVFDQAQLSTYANAQLNWAIGATAYAGQPLIVQGRLLGTLSFASRTRTQFTPEEIDLLQSTCDQMAIALEQANLIDSIQQQAEQLRQANRIKDEFLAVLSHELRSPLNPILGWTRLLQNGRLDAARQVEALNTIERNAKLQAQLIEDLLDISRIMQGKLSLSVAPVSMAFVISAAIETVRLAAEARQIQITLDLEPVDSIAGDAARLQQVVWNLLTNAVKFTPNSGQVIVQLRQINRIVEIRVIDTGKGISPQFLPYVFEYFRQEDGSTTRKFGGLGLGLAIVRQIVEMHGGTVRAESRGENQGATFIVQLPAAPQTIPKRDRVAPEQSHTEAGTPLSNIQILLVDDDIDTREFQTFLLEQSGATVTAVASGLEALQASDRFRPDLLVSDIGMAEIDGYMLIQQIRSRLPAQGGTIPAIALTAYAAEVDQQRALQAGFQAHLTKPIEPSELVKTIVNLLKHR